MCVCVCVCVCSCVHACVRTCVCDYNHKTSIEVCTACVHSLFIFRQSTVYTYFLLVKVRKYISDTATYVSKLRICLLSLVETVGVYLVIRWDSGSVCTLSFAEMIRVPFHSVGVYLVIRWDSGSVRTLSFAVMIRVPFHSVGVYLVIC